MSRSWIGKTQLLQRLGFGLSASCTLLVVALMWMAPEPLTRLENVSVDLLFWLRGERPVGEEIVVVAVDERSLEEIGRWPWSRTTQARLVDAIAAGEPKVIGLDIIYSEAEDTEYLHTLRRLEALMPDDGSSVQAARGVLTEQLESANADTRMENSLKTARDVVLAFPLTVPVTGQNSDSSANPARERSVPTFLKRHQFMVVRHARSSEGRKPYQAVNATLPLERFVEGARSLGHVYGIPDPDGVTRHEFLALGYGGVDEYYPSFALELARIYLGIPRDRMALILGEGVLLDDRRIPTDQRSRMLINFAGPEHTFPTVSVADVISGRTPESIFQDKAVLVGTTALGTYDQKATPFSANVAGVEKHATVLENIIHGQFATRGAWSGPFETAMVLVFGLGLGYLLPRLQPIQGALAAVSAAALYVAGAQYSFATSGNILGVVGPLFVIGTCFVTITVLRLMTVERQNVEIKELFTPYVGPQIVQELMKDPSKATQGVAQRREVTMLFCDLVGFTTLCEKHATDDIVPQVNEYLKAMTEVVFRWDGMVVDFKGDEVYAVWGTPLDQPDHVALAVKCALHMRKRLAELNETWKAEGKPVLEQGIGLNTGTVLVANVGAPGKRMKFTAVGDPVNLAARVEGLTRKFGTSIMISEFTASGVKHILASNRKNGGSRALGHVGLRTVASVRVKGKEQPVIVYELTSLAHDQPSRVDESATLETVSFGEK